MESRRAHFSIWNATGAKVASTAGAQCANFDGEGVGKKCWIPYRFETGRSYRLRVRKGRRDRLGIWWTGTVVDDAGVETKVGRIRAPRGTGRVASTYGFDEYFSAAPCPAPTSAAFFSAPAALDPGKPVYATFDVDDQSQRARQPALRVASAASCWS